MILNGNLCIPFLHNEKSNFIILQIRCTDFLLQQARLIKMFEDNSREGPRVWSKVVVICKHPPSSVYEGQNPRHDS